MDALNLRRLAALVEPDNVASQRVLSATGFQLEGRLRNRDALVFASYH